MKVDQAKLLSDMHDRMNQIEKQRRFWDIVLAMDFIIKPINMFDRYYIKHKILPISFYFSWDDATLNINYLSHDGCILESKNSFVFTAENFIKQIKISIQKNANEIISKTNVTII